MVNDSLKPFRMTFILIIEWKSVILNEITILKVRFRFFIQ